MKKVLSFVFVMMLSLSVFLTACGGGKELMITVDENGLATWEAMEGATGYEISFVYEMDGVPVNDSVEVIQDTSVQIPEGYCIHLRAVYEDGSFSQIAISDYYGDKKVINSADLADEGYAGTEYFGELTASRSTDAYYNYDVDWEALLQWELISNIDLGSVQTAEDGSVLFEAMGPNGEAMRFWGEDITISEAGITFGKDGRIMALDAIGRIYNAYVGISEPGDSDNFFLIFGGYNFNGNSHVDSIDEITASTGMGRHTFTAMDKTSSVFYEFADFQPNFVGFGALPLTYEAGTGKNKDFFTLSEYIICYDDSSYHTGIRDMALYFENYGAHFEGERYMFEKEGLYDADADVYTFALALVPDLQNELYPMTTEEATINNSFSIEGSVGNHFEIGELKDAQGNVLDKETAFVNEGTTLEITIGQYTIDMALTIIPQFKGAQNMNDLVPYAYPEAMGTLNTLVIPIAWQEDSPEVADENYAYFRNALGRVADMSGNIVDYSEEYEGKFSLSEYYDIASYGTLSINSYMTDWYQVPYTYADMKTQSASEEFIDDTLNWLYDTYPNTGWTQFDKDGNGYFDAVIFLNAGESDDDFYTMASFSGGVMFMNSYTNSHAGTTEHPRVNCYTNAHIDLISDNVLIHEFGHNLGLIDYYDVTYSGIDAVGNYDMQSGNFGDWNPYSKFAAGWISPEIVTGLESGQSVDIEIGSLAVSGDAIVIPPAGSEYDGSPFAEYMMVDLFTAEGTNVYDAKTFGLEDAVGVRIYHVNAEMEYREIVSDNIKNPITCQIGTVHVANDYKNDGYGYYHIEVMQSGGDNTFTDVDNLDIQFSEDDLFKAGDVFTAESYDEFLYEGRMDDGSEFGYEIKVVSIEQDENGDYKAVIRITRQ